MRWLDVAGPPGVGKSELCDPGWPPHAIAIVRHEAPTAWREFACLAEGLLQITDAHATGAACRSMMARTWAKMLAVRGQSDSRIYVQTGFAQRGLGIGWRLRTLVSARTWQKSIEDFYQAMPLSAGVVLLTADADTIKRRNVERGKDRSHMVEPMLEVLELAGVVLERRTSVHTIDTRRHVDDCRRELRNIINEAARAHEPAAAGYRG